MNPSSRSVLNSEPSSLKIPHTDPGSQSAIMHRLLFYLHQAQSFKNLVIVCVGTDRSTGDALGPLVGTSLSKWNSPLFHLYGTLDEPVHAVNLQETLDKIYFLHEHPFIIAIDACLGRNSSVGCIQVTEGPLHPGAGVNKKLPPVGNIHLTGIVNISGFMEYFVLQNTRLSLVMKLSDIISKSLYKAITEWHYYSVRFAAQEK